jgi:hypothetical protein
MTSGQTSLMGLLNTLEAVVVDIGNAVEDKPVQKRRTAA